MRQTSFPVRVHRGSVDLVAHVSGFILEPVAIKPITINQLYDALHPLLILICLAE